MKKQYLLLACCLVSVSSYGFDAGAGGAGEFKQPKSKSTSKPAGKATAEDLEITNRMGTRLNFGQFTGALYTLETLPASLKVPRSRSGGQQRYDFRKPLPGLGYGNIEPGETKKVDPKATWITVEATDLQPAEVVKQYGHNVEVYGIKQVAGHDVYAVKYVVELRKNTGLTSDEEARTVTFVDARPADEAASVDVGFVLVKEKGGKKTVLSSKTDRLDPHGKAFKTDPKAEYVRFNGVKGDFSIAELKKRYGSRVKVTRYGVAGGWSPRGTGSVGYTIEFAKG